MEITWEVPYTWSRPRPATYLDPPEPGLELDGEARPIEVAWWPRLADELIIGGIQDGSILDALLVQKYGLPPEDLCWEAAGDDNDSRREGAFDIGHAAYIAYGIF